MSEISPPIIIPPQTTIASINAMPYSPYNGRGIAGIIITNGCPSYFMITGANLDRIVSVNWYPKNAASVQFTTRQLILVDNTLGTFMVMVTDNYYNVIDRAGHLSFRLVDGTTLTYPVVTYGQLGPLWTSPETGLITG
jgi:hypothetical protein